MTFDRTVKYATDACTGEIYDADVVFKETSKAHEYRKLYNEGKLDIICNECEQELIVSSSRYSRIHFKHKPNSSYCILKDTKITEQENDQIQEHIFRRESDRHKELKEKIFSKLLGVRGINHGTLAKDDKFLSHGNEKRRPDIYCEYHGKKIVFEIQLSKLPLRYILSRYNFYKKNEIYLVWILDDFDVINGQNQMEKDIKYLTKYQNFFKLDEIHDEFRLSCKYKVPFLDGKNNIRSKWRNTSISFNQMKFSTKDYQVFYFNFKQKNEDCKNEQKRIELVTKEKKAKQIEDIRQRKSLIRVESLINQLRELQKQSFNYTLSSSIEKAINDLSVIEIELLNLKLDWSQKKVNGDEYILHYWLSNISRKGYTFLILVLKMKSIKLDINYCNSSGEGAFTKLIENSNIHHSLQRELFTYIFYRGYALAGIDIVSMNMNWGNSSNFQYRKMKIFYLDKLKGNSLVFDLDTKKLGALLILESAKRKTIMASKLKSWIGYGNNAIRHYRIFWGLIEKGFKYYGVFELIIEQDKRKTFRSALRAWEEEKPSQDLTFRKLVAKLYPEIF